MEIDTVRLKEKFAFVEKYVIFTRKFLSARNDITKWDLEADIQAQRLFEIISQVFLDVGTHIIAHSQGVTPPSSHAECMVKLSDLGIISKDDGNIYANLAQMRNLIAHNYVIIDRIKLHDGLREIIDNLEKFRRSVFAWLNARKIK
jgi:uncharacterized protein YutE (UPF0331/DUF86 family)